MATVRGQELPLDPRGTFLRTDPGDSSTTARAIDLAQLGYRPGQQIRLRTVGDFIWHPGQLLTGENAVAVFSRSSVVQAANNRHRVPDAIQTAAPAYVTGPTYQQSLDNDIPEDFLVSPAGVNVVIPDNGSGSAAILLVGADDVFWGDNLDPENDFAIAIERPLGQELLANPGFEVNGIQGWTVPANQAFAVTSYGLSNTPTVAIGTQVQGGIRLLRGGGTMWQTFDISGNAAAIDAGTLFVQLGGHFGGYLNHQGFAYLQAVFENTSGGSTGTTVGVGTIREWNRNYQTTLMRRGDTFPIPAGTRVLRIQLVLDFNGSSGHVVFADNLSARLVQAWTPQPQAMGVELMDNGGFESGDLINPNLPSGWTLLYGNGLIDSYGGSVTPAAAIGNTVNGGQHLVRGGFTAEQRFDLRGNAATIDAGTLFVQLGGHFGGYLNHQGFAYLQAVFENTSGGSTGTTVGVGAIREWNRNYQTTLMRRGDTFPIPAGTRVLRVQLVLDFNGSSGHVVFADNLSARLVQAWTPQPQAMGVDLMDNGGFESGNLINPNLPSGWTLLYGNGLIDSYGGSVTPSAAIGNTVNGGQHLVRGGFTAEQRFDLRGNAATIDAGTLFVQLGGHFGGYLNHQGFAYLQAAFENTSGGSTGTTVGVGTIREWNRNYQTSLMRRGDTFPIPAGTRVLRIQLVLDFNGSSGHVVFADNLSARLLTNWTPPPLPLGAELLGNADFESGDFIAPNIERSWTVTSGNGFALSNYGAPNMPLPSVSNSIGGGAFLARASSGASEAIQVLDLRAHAAAIDNQNLALALSGYFGGVTNNSGTALLRVEAYAEFGGSIPIPNNTVGNVTAGERNQVTTLLHRSGEFLLPFGTRRVHVVLRSSDGNGLADNLSARLRDVSTGPLFPGTGDGFLLLSGVNAQPSGGPRADSKTASAGNLLTLHINSAANRFAGGPLFFACNAFATGTSVPPFGLPGLHVNPAAAGFNWLLDGVTPQGPFGPPTVLPGGTTLSFVVPPGLVGWNLLFQALTLHPASANGVYATTDGHTIRFL